MSEQDFDLQPAEPAPEFDLRPALEQEQTEPVSLTAFKAARGPAPEQAAKALQLAKDHGVSPQFAADHAEAMQQITDQGGFEDALGVSPVLSAFAGQSAVHASAVKDDVTVLQSLEMGLADVGYAAMARKYMDATPEERVKLEEGLSAYEEAAQQFAGKKPGFLAEVARAIPNVAAYGASTVAGASLGGKGGGTLGMGAALYQLNRGVLFRRIVEQFPTPEERNFAAGRDVPDAEFAQWQKEYEAQTSLAKEYAKKGALTGAVIGAVLGDAFTRSLPLAHEALEKIGQEIATKALADTVAKAALQRGTELAGHTLSGALLMAEQATVDDATVQQATTGKIDTGKALAAGKDAFVDGFGVALVLSAATPVKEFFGDLGRIRDAKVELGRLDDQVARAKGSKFVQRSPQEAEALLGKMAAAGDTPTVYIDQQGLQAPEVAQKLVEALADGGQLLAQAEATQGDVAVPMGTYLTKIAPDLHEQLREHTKLSSDGYTVTQATEAEKALPQEPDKAVFDEYRQKALAAGRGAQESVAIGKIVSAAMQRFADGEGLGRSAADVSAQFPIDIGAAASEGMRLDQGEYRGTHRPPTPQSGAPLHDLTGGGTVYPEDVYGPNAARYYGHGDQVMDAATVRILQGLRGKPDAKVTVYRAVPKSAADATIAAGDWVTVNRDYAKEHARRFEGGAKILSKKVKASEVFTNGDSIHEAGYWPAGSASLQQADTLDVLKQQPVEGTPLTASAVSERGHIVVGFPGENGGRQFAIDLSNPDRSTLAHETFHALSVIMGDIAQKDTAHPEFRKDYDTLTRFMGYESAGDRAGALDPAKEEKAALAWEQYLFEGKAPSPELRGTFSRFKTWLTRIYGALKGNLPDDVRKVFDRMLAREKTQGEIDYAGHATAIIESKPIAEIQPGRYELAARRAGAKAMDLAREGSRDSKLITPQRPQGEPVRYEVVEAKSLVPSHSPESFTPNEAYPEGVQERFYQGQGEEQLKVVEGGAKLNPALLLANTPSPLDGPPIVTGGSKRIVLGGNGRTMMIQRAFKNQAAREQYRQALTARAREFGISPDEVAKLKEPVLVRVVPGLTEASPKAELVGAVRRFNEGMTQALSPKARALAEARTLTPETVDALGGLMFEHGDSSLRDVLRDRPKEVLDVLRRDGVINAQNQTQWISGDALTSDAKARIEGMFVGRVIENEGRLNATAPEVLNKVEKAAPYLLRVAGINPALDETGTVRKAVDLLNNARAQGLKLEDALGQGELLKKHDEAVVAMAELLATATPRDIGTRFKKWATFAGVDPRQTGMFGTAPTLETSLGTLLGGPERFKGYERAAEEPAPPPKAQAAAAPEQAQAPAEQQPQQSDLQKYRTASDLSHAMADVATKVKAEMERGREYLKSRDTDKFRGDLGKAGQEYIGAFDAILEAIDENTPRAQAQPEALDALLARMQADGEPIGFDAEDLRNLLAKPIGWKALTPPEARNVVNAVKNLRAAARRVNEVVLAGQKAQLRDVVKGMQTYLDARGTPDSGLPAPSGASSGEIEGAAAWVDKAATEGLQARVILERLGPNGRAIYDEFVRSRNLKEDLARDVGKEVAKFYDALPKELKKTRFDGVNGPGSPVFNDNLWTRQDMWEFASWWGSESGSDRIKAGLRITDGQAHEFMAQITSAEADLIDAKHKMNDEVLWPKVRDHAREVTGTEPTKIEARPFTIRLADGSMREMRGGYEPALYRADLQSMAKAPSDAQSIADYWGALKDNFEPSTANYFTKERAQNVARVPDLNWSRYSGHVGSVLQYLAYDDFVRNVGRVFRDQGFRDLVRQRLGPQEIRELDKFLGVAARGRVESGSDGANELSRMVGNGLRSRLATAAFQLNPRVWLGQMSHLPAAMFRLGLSPSDMVYGLSQSLRPSTWGESFDGSKQLPYRWNGYGSHMRAQLANIGPGDGPLTGRRMDAAQWSVYHVIDGFLSKTIYEAAASKAERAGATPEEARLAGDRGVERMMPPLNLAEQSSLARDRGMIGALILVRNFPNQLYNAGAETMWEARNAVWSADPGWAKAKAVLGAGTVAAAQYLGMVWSAHLFGRFLMGHGRQDDETWSDWGEREALAAPFYPIPFGSEIAEPVAEALVTDKTLKQSMGRHGLAAAPAIAELERAIRDLGTVVGSANPDEDRIFAGLRLAANALRLPSDPLRGARYGFDLLQGNVQPRGPFDLAGGFLYGERPRQTKNPFTTAQDLVSGD